MIERKVAIPAAVTTSIVALVSSMLFLLRAFGVDLSEEQMTAVVGVVIAVLPVVQFVVGYNTRHTPRPDLADGDDGHKRVGMHRHPHVEDGPGDH